MDLARFAHMATERLTPRVWGRGYTADAARTVLTAHFGDPDAGDVGSSYFIGNKASAHMLEKLGFRETGACRLAALSLGREVDGCAMALTRVDWQKALPDRA